VIDRCIPGCDDLPQSPEPQIILKETAGIGTLLALQWLTGVRPSAATLFLPLPFTNPVTRSNRRCTMTDEDDREFKAELMRLQQEHRDLDAAIAALQSSPASDLLQLQRLKKRKLQLRDRIAFIEDQITPDIIA
jgi:hypothetical protein